MSLFPRVVILHQGEMIELIHSGLMLRLSEVMTPVHFGQVGHLLMVEIFHLNLGILLAI